MNWLRSLTLALAVTSSASNAFATVRDVPSAKVNAYLIGWYTTDLLVQLSTPTINPDNCPSGDLYILPSDSPQNQSITAAIMSAEATGKSVKLVIDGCAGNRPKIIGIWVGQV